MRTIKLTVQYDGTEFVGWQRQPIGTSIQGLLEDALEKIDGQPVTVHGAGRTDAGVHALAQVASVRLASAIDLDALVRAMNANLPPAVRVFAAEEMPEAFHARFSARGKAYEYRVWNGPVVPPFVRLYVWHVPRPLDLDAMQRASASLVGEHDFSAFQGTGSSTHTPVRTVHSASWRADGALRVFEIAGEGFLRHMVRSIVGTLVDVGVGRLSPEQMGDILASRRRADAGLTAPPSGLFLARVDY